MEGYANSLAHLVEEIQRFDLSIRFQVQQVTHGQGLLYTGGELPRLAQRHRDA